MIRHAESAHRSRFPPKNSTPKWIWAVVIVTGHHPSGGNAGGRPPPKKRSPEASPLLFSSMHLSLIVLFLIMTRPAPGRVVIYYYNKGFVCASDAPASIPFSPSRNRPNSSASASGEFRLTSRWSLAARAWPVRLVVCGRGRDADGHRTMAF